MKTTFRPGKVTIEELIILPASGNFIDITGMFIEMSIYENIYASSLSGVITIVDTKNLISEVPLLGEEYVSFRFKVLDTDDTAHLMFRVYKISDREIQGNKQMYKIHFTTLEMYMDATNSVSKTFTGHAETIISQLMGDIVKTSGSSKSFTFDPSGNMLKLTSPWWSQFKCINWAAQKAVSADKERSSDFLFFETFTGYKFKNVSQLKNTASKTFFKFDHNRTGGDVTSEMTTALDFYTPQILDQLERFRDGVYKTKVYAHDTTFKAINIHSYDLDEKWNARPHLNKFPHHSLSFGGTSFYSDQIKTAPEAAYSHDDKQYDWQGLITSQRTSEVMLNELIKVDVEVWGRMGLEPGHVVDLKVGKLVQSDTTYDDYYSGRYLISAIHHRFAPNEYKMYMQLVKDSVAVEFK